VRLSGCCAWHKPIAGVA